MRNEGRCNVKFFVPCLSNARFGNIDFDRAISQEISIEHADRLVCLSCVGMDTEAKPFETLVALSLTRSTEETVPA